MRSSNTNPDTAQREHVVLRVRAHGRQLLFPSVLMIAAAAAAGYWAGTLPELWQNGAVWAGFAACVLIWCVAGVRWLTTRLIFTQRRLIMKRGVLVQHTSEVSYAKIREVRTRRSVLQRLFGSGQVILLTGAAPDVVLRDVPRCEMVCEALRELIDHYFEESQQSMRHHVFDGPMQPLNGAAQHGSVDFMSVDQGTAQPDYAPTVAVRDDRAGYASGRIVRRSRSTPNGRNVS